jgi:hypothetical protein
MKALSPAVTSSPGRSSCRVAASRSHTGPSGGVRPSNSRSSSSSLPPTCWVRNVPSLANTRRTSTGGYASWRLITRSKLPSRNGSRPLSRSQSALSGHHPTATTGIPSGVNRRVATGKLGLYPSVATVNRALGEIVDGNSPPPVPMSSIEVAPGTADSTRSRTSHGAVTNRCPSQEQSHPENGTPSASRRIMPRSAIGLRSSPHRPRSPTVLHGTRYRIRGTGSRREASQYP